MSTESYDNYFCPELREVFDEIRDGRFGSVHYFSELLDGITNKNDKYLIGKDFPSYLAAQARIDEDFLD